MSIPILKCLSAKDNNIENIQLVNGRIMYNANNQESGIKPPNNKTQL